MSEVLVEFINTLFVEPLNPQDIIDINGDTVLLLYLEYSIDVEKSNIIPDPFTELKIIGTIVIIEPAKYVFIVSNLIVIVSLEVDNNFTIYICLNG